MQQIQKNLDATQKEVLLSKEAKEMEKTRQQEEKQSIKDKIDFFVEEVLFKNFVKYLSSFLQRILETDFSNIHFSINTKREDLLRVQ